MDDGAEGGVHETGSFPSRARSAAE